MTKKEEVIRMPRGVKREINYETELAQIEQKINKHKMQISSLEARRQEITDLQQKAEAEKLMRFLAKNALSVNDAIEKLSVSS